MRGLLEKESDTNCYVGPFDFGYEVGSCRRVPSNSFGGIKSIKVLNFNRGTTSLLTTKLPKHRIFREGEEREKASLPNSSPICWFLCINTSRTNTLRNE